jgi:hypothetical protein
MRARFFTGQVIVTGFANPLTAGQVVHLGVGAQALQQAESVRIFCLVTVLHVGPGQLMDPVVWIVQIAKGDGPGWTGLGTGGLVVRLFQVRRSSVKAFSLAW